MRTTSFKTAPLFLLCIFHWFAYAQNVGDYLKVIHEYGENPVQFVQEKLNSHDLLIFDDALHNALEPFEFYGDLLDTDNNKIDYVFIEVFGINTQHHIDAYLENEVKDQSLLLKVFQDSFSGYGWQYETYLDLLSTIWDINHSKSKSIKAIAVDQPIYWEGIHTRRDYDVFLKSLVGRDYFMYKTIVGTLDNFKSEKKGVFLTNTRHAYKQIRNKNGKLYWNCGTFFSQWHPKKTYSIRIHNATLSIKDRSSSKNDVTSDGLGRYTYEWIKMENGIWDEAFSLNDNAPVAFSMKDNVFGLANYIGNHMLNVEKNQTMYDAYDGLIFLKPLNALHFSAKTDFFYTDSFKTELERRLKILHEEKLDAFLLENEVSSLRDYIDQITSYQKQTSNDLIQDN
nr:hypothetical protein [Allomuricauda sp.]